jgi:hypothetical protein
VLASAAFEAIVLWLKDASSRLKIGSGRRGDLEFAARAVATEAIRGARQRRTAAKLAIGAVHRIAVPSPALADEPREVKSRALPAVAEVVELASVSLEQLLRALKFVKPEGVSKTGRKLRESDMSCVVLSLRTAVSAFEVFKLAGGVSFDPHGATATVSIDVLKESHRGVQIGAGHRNALAE